MKKIFYSLLLITTIVSCNRSGIQTTEEKDGPVKVTMDLVNVSEDKVSVTVNPGRFEEGSLIYNMPKTVPGTYSTDDYGRLIENVRAFSYEGDSIAVDSISPNQFSISSPETFDYLTYEVNDSYDIDGELGIFSPSGTNIAAGDNFVLNLHGFIGYFNDKTEIPYQLTISHPQDLLPSTSLDMIEEEEADETDEFSATRYFEITDNPIFYTSSTPEKFTVGDMEVILDVHSPNDAYSATDLLPNIQKMVKAQKNYLDDINDTPLYAILLYLSKMDGADANGFGALEHHTSTVVVLPEQMPMEGLNETMTDVVSHEFFHTLTPLNVHSEEIQYFDYADPEMSQHLWMYEGVTEYFANHFQVHEELIEPDAFYNRMQTKINNSRRYTDTMAFTVMSENVLEDPYEDEYLNVYEKGALIGMALDIRLRELSNGQEGILHLMGELSKKFGKEQPFKDEELIPVIVDLTYPEIQNFFDQYVTGSTPIPYNQFFEKVGLQFGETEQQTSLFLQDMQTPYIGFDQETKEIYFPKGTEFNSMLKSLGVQGGDVLQSFNGKEYDLDSIRPFIMTSMALQAGNEVTMTVLRDGKEVELSGTFEQPTAMIQTLGEMDLPNNDPRVQLREAWLYN